MDRGGSRSDCRRGRWSAGPRNSEDGAEPSGSGIACRHGEFHGGRRRAWPRCRHHPVSLRAGLGRASRLRRNAVQRRGRIESYGRSSSTSASASRFSAPFHVHSRILRSAGSACTSCTASSEPTPMRCHRHGRALTAATFRGPEGGEDLRSPELPPEVAAPEQPCRPHQACNGVLAGVQTAGRQAQLTVAITGSGSTDEEDPLMVTQDAVNSRADTKRSEGHRRTLAGARPTALSWIAEMHCSRRDKALAGHQSPILLLILRPAWLSYLGQLGSRPAQRGTFISGVSRTDLHRWIEAEVDATAHGALWSLDAVDPASDGAGAVGPDESCGDPDEV